MTRWIHGISRELLRAAFKEYFGVAIEHCDILIILFERPGEWVTTRKMQALVNSHRPPKRGVIHERIRVLREILEAESLDSGGQLDDTGYQLTEVGFEECRKALRRMADVLLKGGHELPQLPGLAVEIIEPAEEVRALPAPEDLSPPLRTAGGRG